MEVELRRVLAARETAGIGDGIRYLLDSGGKRFRPALALWHLGAFGRPPRDGLSFALALELLHNYFLIHDDIEDGDEVRRDRPTLWVQVGMPLALNAGDYLLAEAYVLLAGIEPAGVARQLVAAFSRVFRTTVEGQALDIQGRADPAFTRARYEAIIRKKTGRYLALAGVGAGILAGRPASDLDGLERAGQELGLAFQMRDDLLDLTPGKGRGREIGCDIREGKPSCLFADALEAEEVTAAERAELVAILARPRRESTPAAVEWVIRLYERAGCLGRCQALAERHASTAVAEFAALGGLTEGARAEYRSIADAIVRRGA